MTEKERAAIKADDEIVKNASLGEFIEGYALGYRNIVKSLLYIWGGCAALVVMKTMDADASMVSIIAKAIVVSLPIAVVFLIAFLFKKRQKVAIFKDGFIWQTKRLFFKKETKVRFADMKGIYVAKRYCSDKNGDYTCVSVRVMSIDNAEMLKWSYTYSHSGEEYDPFVKTAPFCLFLSRKKARTQKKSFCCDGANAGEPMIKIESLKAQEKPFSYKKDTYGSAVLGYAVSAVCDVWNRVALERANKELAERGHCVFYVREESTFLDPLWERGELGKGKLKELEIGRGYIKYNGHYAGEKSEYQFSKGYMFIYPSEADRGMSGKNGNFVIPLNNVYNRQIFLLAASELLGVDLNVDGYKWKC